MNKRQQRAYRRQNPLEWSIWINLLFLVAGLAILFLVTFSIVNAALSEIDFRVCTAVTSFEDYERLDCKNVLKRNF